LPCPVELRTVGETAVVWLFGVPARLFDEFGVVWGEVLGRVGVVVRPVEGVVCGEVVR